MACRQLLLRHTNGGFGCKADGGSAHSKHGQNAKVNIQALCTTKEPTNKGTIEHTHTYYLHIKCYSATIKYNVTMLLSVTVL